LLDLINTMQMRLLARIQLSVFIDLNFFKFDVHKILYISVGTSGRHDRKAPYFLVDFVTPRHREELRKTYVYGNSVPVVREI